MKYSATSKPSKKYDVVFVPVFEKTNIATVLAEYPAVLAQFDTTQIKKVLVKGDIFIVPSKKGGVSRLIVTCIDDKKNFSAEKAQTRAVELSRSIKGTASSVLWCVDHIAIKGNCSFVQAVAEMCGIVMYDFAMYKKPAKDKRILKVCDFYVSDEKSAKAILRGVGFIVDGVNRARDLINEPANVVIPKEFARRVASVARKTGLSVTQLTMAQIKKEKMGGLLAVGKGSEHEPAFLVIKYSPKKKKKRICLVGKGVCFDSGGLSLKPASSMMTMKYDMAGAAVASQLPIIAAQLKLPVEVISIMPLCENSPSATAYRPGDVIRISSGHSVEVLNTDAEGRLILADALHYAKRFKADYVIDFATLTGAAQVCLGNKAAAILGTDDTLITKIQKAGDSVGERVWQLPLWDAYKDDLKSGIADMKNIGFEGAGTITAAMFLSHFVTHSKWAHLDIAAVGWDDKGKKYGVVGPTGFGIRIMSEFLRQVCA